MEFVIFKLETVRNDIPIKGKPYGRATLFDPGGKAEQLSSDPESLSGRKDSDDDTWEQRVIAVVIDFLEARGAQFRSLTDATPHPNTFSKRIWMIVTSR